tara:strand:+ start:574 stop:957 length:384 start_codon:yes stop_codon:yes gene_type:complete
MNSYSKKIWERNTENIFSIIIFCSYILLFASMNSCSSQKRQESKFVKITGITLVRGLNQFKEKNGIYPENLKDLLDDSKENIRSEINIESWRYVKNELYYILIYKKRIDGRIYILQPDLNIVTCEIQ